MRFLKTLALICGLVAPAAAGQYFNTPVTSTATGSAWQSLSGQFYFAASSANVSTTTALIPTKSTWTITMDGATGNVWAKLYTAVTGFIGNLTGNVTGNLTGNVTGNLTGTASNATLAVTATNIGSGAAGSFPYQTGSGATSFISAVAGKLLSIVGTTPTWLGYLPETVTISTANVSPGFNAASNFVQLTGAGFYPALNGSLITNISGTISGLTSGKTIAATSATSIVPGSEYDNGAGAMTLPTSSSYTVAGNATQQSTMTFGTSAVNQNTTTNTNGILLYSASFSSITVPSFSYGFATAFQVCNATITIVSHGNPIEVHMDGSILSIGATSTTPIVLLDGNFVNGESSTVGLGTPFNVNTSFLNSFFFHTLIAASAGKHSICFSALDPGSSGTSQTLCGAAGAANAATNGCSFMAKEIH